MTSSRSGVAGVEWARRQPPSTGSAGRVEAAGDSGPFWGGPSEGISSPLFEQTLSQLLAAAPQQAGHGLLGLAQALGDGADRQLVVVAQDDDIALGLGQFVEGLGELPQRLQPF